MGILVTKLDFSKIKSREDFVKAIENIIEKDIVGYTATIKITFVDNTEQSYLADKIIYYKNLTKLFYKDALTFCFPNSDVKTLEKLEHVEEVNSVETAR